jgi:hypothetical protein
MPEPVLYRRLTALCRLFLLMVLWCCCDSEFFLKPRLSSLQRRLKDHEYSIYSIYKDDDDSDQAKSLAREREQLYEAYNLLHSLAQVSRCHWSIAV